MTIASLALALTAAAAVAAWLSCAPKMTAAAAPLARLDRPAPVKAESALAAAKDAPASSPAPIRAAQEAPSVAQVLDHPSCSTDVVRGLSRQIIAEENCLRPSGYVRLPAKLPGAVLQDTVFPYLMQPARDAFVAALEGSREPIEVNSMLRTIAQQYLLYDWYQRGKCHIRLAAQPGRSNHQSGLAIDVAQPARWRARLARHGFRWMGAKDRVHFDFVGRDEREKEQQKRLADANAGLDVKAFQRLWNRNHAGERLPEDGDFDARTEDALRRSPADGFAIGVHCTQ